MRSIELYLCSPNILFANQSKPPCPEVIHQIIVYEGQEGEDYEQAVMQ